MADLSIEDILNILESFGIECPDWLCGILNTSDPSEPSSKKRKIESFSTIKEIDFGFESLPVELQVAILEGLSGEDIIALAQVRHSLKSCIQAILNARSGETQLLHRSLVKKVAEAMLIFSNEGKYLLNERCSHIILSTLFYTTRNVGEKCFDGMKSLHLKKDGLEVTVPIKDIIKRVNLLKGTKAGLQICFSEDFLKRWSKQFFAIRDSLPMLTFDKLTLEQQFFFNDSADSVWNQFDKLSGFTDFWQSLLSLNLIKTVPSAVLKKVFLIGVYMAHSKAIQALLERPEFDTWKGAPSL